MHINISIWLIRITNVNISHVHRFDVSVQTCDRILDGLQIARQLNTKSRDTLLILYYCGGHLLTKMSTDSPLSILESSMARLLAACTASITMPRNPAFSSVHNACDIQVYSFSCVYLLLVC